MLQVEPQWAALARAPAWQSLYLPRKWWSRWLDLQLPKHGRRCRRAGSAPPGWCAASWSGFGTSPHIFNCQNLNKRELERRAGKCDCSLSLKIDIINTAPDHCCAAGCLPHTIFYSVHKCCDGGVVVDGSVVLEVEGAGLCTL